MLIHYYKTAQDAAAHNETVEEVRWIDGFTTNKSSEITFLRVSDDMEITIPLANFITVVSDKDKAVSEVYEKMIGLFKTLKRRFPTRNGYLPHGFIAQDHVDLIIERLQTYVIDNGGTE